MGYDKSGYTHNLGLILKILTQRILRVSENIVFGGPHYKSPTLHKNPTRGDNVGRFYLAGHFPTNIRRKGGNSISWGEGGRNAEQWDRHSPKRESLRAKIQSEREIR